MLFALGLAGRPLGWQTALVVVFLGGVLLATTRTVQGVMGKAATQDSEIWFFGILFVSTTVFIIYSYWGGIIAAIRTDMIQGLMIIVLSFIAIPLAFNKVDGLTGTRSTLGTAAQNINQAIPEAIEQWKAGDVQGALAGLRSIEKQDAGGTVSQVFILYNK